MRKPEEKQKCLELRRTGVSIKKIAKILGVGVGTVSDWTRNIELTDRQKESLRYVNRNLFFDKYELEVNKKEFIGFLSIPRSIRSITTKFSCSRNFAIYLSEKLGLKSNIKTTIRQMSGKKECCEMCGNKKRIVSKNFCMTCVSKIRRMSNKIKAVRLLGAKCSICGWIGEEKEYPAYEFHHPNEKNMQMGDVFNYNWEKVREELKLCVLLCSRCHRILHSDYNDDNLIKMILDKISKE